MKSFYILPYIIVHANVIFDKKEEAEFFVENAKLNSNFMSANLQDEPFGGQYYVSVNYEEYGKKFLITLADEDLVDTINEYFKNAWPELSIIGDNWEVYEDIPMIRLFIECCDCGKEKEIDMVNGDFGGFLYRTTIKNQVDDFVFMCNECYDFNNDHQPDEWDLIDFSGFEEYLEQKYGKQEN